MNVCRMAVYQQPTEHSAQTEARASISGKKRERQRESVCGFVSVLKERMCSQDAIYSTVREAFWKK